MKIKIHCDDGYETFLQVPNDILFEQVVEEVCDLRRAHGYDLIGHVVPSTNQKRGLAVAYQLRHNQTKKGNNNSSSLEYSNHENVSLKLALNSVSGFQNGKFAEFVVYIYGFKSQEQTNMLQQLYQFSSKLTLANMSFTRAVDKYARAFPVAQEESLLMVTEKSHSDGSSSSRLPQNTSKTNVLESVSDRVTSLFHEIRNVFDEASSRVELDPSTKQILIRAKNLFTAGDLAGAMSLLQFPTTNASSDLQTPPLTNLIRNEPASVASSYVGANNSNTVETIVTNAPVPAKKLPVKKTEAVIPAEKPAEKKSERSGSQSTTNSTIRNNNNNTNTVSADKTAANMSVPAVVPTKTTNAIQPVNQSSTVIKAIAPVLEEIAVKKDSQPTAAVSEESATVNKKLLVKPMVTTVVQLSSTKSSGKNKSSSSSSSSSSESSSSSSSSSSSCESESDSDDDNASKGTQVTSSTSSSTVSKKSSETLHSEHETNKPSDPPPTNTSNTNKVMNNNSLPAPTIKSLKDIAEMETQKLLLSSQEDIIDQIFEPLTSPSRNKQDVKPSHSNQPLPASQPPAPAATTVSSGTKKVNVPFDLRPKKADSPLTSSPVKMDVVVAPKQKPPVRDDSDSDSEASTASSSSTVSSSASSSTRSKQSGSGDDSRSDSEDDSSSSSSSSSEDEKEASKDPKRATKKNQNLALTNQTSVKKPALETTKLSQPTETPSALKSLLGAGSTPIAPGRPSIGPAIIPISTTKATPVKATITKKSESDSDTASDSDDSSSSASSDTDDEKDGKDKANNDDKDDDIGDLPKFPVMKDQVLPGQGRRLRSNSKTDDTKVVTELPKPQKTTQPVKKEPTTKKPVGFTTSATNTTAAGKKGAALKATVDKKEKVKKEAASAPSLRSLIDGNGIVSDKEEEMVYFTKSPVVASPVSSPVKKAPVARKRTAAAAGLPETAANDTVPAKSNKPKAPTTKTASKDSATVAQSKAATATSTTTSNKRAKPSK